MISSQHFPDTEKDGENPPGQTDTFPEAIWCLHYIKPTRGTFYYPNGSEDVMLNKYQLQL